MRVLVTGGAGFVGSHLVDLLIEEGCEVRVIDLLHPLAHEAQPGYLNPGAEYVWGDLRDPALAGRCVDGVDAVSHQAAMVGLGADLSDVTDYVGHNSGGTASLLKALWEAGFTGRLVLASSMVIYGEGRYLCPRHGEVRAPARREEDLEAGRFEVPCPSCGRGLAPGAVAESAAPDPRNVYAVTKLEQEGLCAAFGRESGAPVAALRYHNVYGPRMPRDTPYAGVASIFRSALEAGEAPRVFEDGAQMRDFVHVTDVARANALALLAESPFDGAVNVASGAPRTVGEMASALSRAVDGPEPVLTGGYRLGDVRHVFASAELARAQLGFSAEVGFERGIADLAAAGQRGGGGTDRGGLASAQTNSR